MKKMEESRENTTAFVNQQVGRVMNNNEIVQHDQQKWDKIIGDNLHSFELCMQRMEREQQRKMMAPDTEVYRQVMRDFSGMREQWEIQRQ